MNGDNNIIQQMFGAFGVRYIHLKRLFLNDASIYRTIVYRPYEFENLIIETYDGFVRVFSLLVQIEFKRVSARIK